MASAVLQRVVAEEGEADRRDRDDEGALPAEVRELARLELREEAALRAHSLRQLRHYVEKHPAIDRCRTDAPFLLRFLRTKKFSVPLASTMLERYLVVRASHPHWFARLDPLDPALAAVVRAGYLVPLAGRDAQGRKLILSCAARFDPHKFDSCTMARVHSMIVELLMDEQESQVCGYTYVNDEAGLSMPHLSLWSLRDIRTMLDCIQNSTPMRHKMTHLLHVPALGARVVEFALSVLSDKLRERVHLHRNVEELRESLGAAAALLPAEYGGARPLADHIAQLERDLLAARPRLLALDEMSVDVSRLDCAAHRTHTTDPLAAPGSFRKLDLD